MGETQDIPLGEKATLGNQVQNSPSSIVSDDSFINPDGINEKKLLRKLDLKLLPPLTLLYLLSFLDRSNSMFPNQGYFNLADANDR